MEDLQETLEILWKENEELRAENKRLNAFIEGFYDKTCSQLDSLVSFMKERPKFQKNNDNIVKKEYEGDEENNNNGDNKNFNVEEYESPIISLKRRASDSSLRNSAHIKTLKSNSNSYQLLPTINLEEVKTNATHRKEVSYRDSGAFIVATLPHKQKKARSSTYIGNARIFESPSITFANTPQLLHSPPSITLPSSPPPYRRKKVKSPKNSRLSPITKIKEKTKSETIKTEWTSPMKCTNGVFISLRHDCPEEGKTLIKIIECFINMQPHSKRPEWYHGQLSVTKIGEGSYYPRFGEPILCGTWDNNSLIEAHHHHISPESVLRTHLEQYHPNECKSPPVSPRLILDSDSIDSPKLPLFDMILPDELRILIFSYLSIASICRAAQVSTEWKRLTNDHSLWCKIYILHWGKYRDPYTNNILPIEGGIDWKETVKGKYLLDRNWRLGKCYASTLRGHSGWVTSVDLYTNKLVSSSYDGTVRVWNTQTGNALRTLPADYNNQEGLSPVWCVKFKGNAIMAGYSNSVVRQWDMNSGQCVRTFEGHAGGVKCLHFDEETNQLLSGSDDKSVKVFDIRSGACIRTLQFGAPVVNLQHHDDTLLTIIKRENEVYWYDMKTNSLVKTLSGHTKAVYCLQYDHFTNTLMTGSRDKLIFQWDLLKGEKVKEFSGHQFTVMSLQFDSSKIVSGSADRTVKIWDIQSGECVNTLSGHSEVVMSVSFDQTKIVSGSADKTVVVWDFLRSN